LIEEEFPPEEPEGPPGDGELIEEKIPPEPPKTGEFPPAIIYGAGLLLVLAGLLLRKKAQGAFRNNKGR
jgi:LPXTG-motif cell wall-anchored protein